MPAPVSSKTMSEPVLSLEGIQKKFGGIHALRDISLSILPGEVHGLVGENGAGKSTLINIATGLFTADNGAACLNAQPYHPASPQQATQSGVYVVHQEADLFPQLSIAENMLLGEGLERNALGLLHWRKIYTRAAQRVAALGESFNVRQDAAGLSVARRTMAEIATAVAHTPKVLFLDEPTASLTGKEINTLFQQIERLKAAGTAIVYVSHRLDEVLKICDRVTVLRDGVSIKSAPAGDWDMDTLIASMVGRNVVAGEGKRSVALGDVRLHAHQVTTKNNRCQDISLQVRAGEIVGLYGFVGAGRSEFAQALFGLHPLKQGSVTLDGKEMQIRTPGQAVQQGLAYLPEDRLVQGVFRGHSLRANASVSLLRKLSRRGLLSNRAETELAAKVILDMQVRADSMEQAIGTLSGGNQQKVVFGRWQATAPKVLMLDEPTRGVDVGAKAEIHKLICDMAEKGTAILLISSELPEIMSMSDRVITLSEGKISGEFVPGKDDEAAIAAAAIPRQHDRVPTSQPERSLLTRFLEFREAGLFAFILLLSAIMAGLRPDSFATTENFLDILVRAAIPAILAQGAMFIICTGGIDISVGSMMGLTAALTATAAKQGLPPIPTLGLGMLLGLGFSLLNGGLSLAARIHPIIVTLAGISIYRGTMHFFTGGREIILLPDTFRALSDGLYLGIPKICYYVIIVTFIAHILLRYTLTGRQILALGNSESAARLIGLSKTRLTLFVFALSGALVGLAAILQTGFYGKVQSNSGEGYELQAIAAAVIGGTNILGGRGSAIGTLLGAFLIALVYNSLILLEASAYWQNIFVGSLILAAVALDALLSRLRGTAS